MQSTGQTSTQAVSFVPMHGSVMMYATRMSSKGSKGSSQPRSITRATAGILAALAVLVCTNLRPAARVRTQLSDTPSTTFRAGPSTALRAGWREAPQYISLFVPPTQRAAYRAYVSPLGLEAILEQLTADPAILRPPGAWTPQ